MAWVVPKKTKTEIKFDVGFQNYPQKRRKNGTYIVDCNFNNNSGGANMSAVTYRNLDVISVTLGCSGWNVKRAFLHLHLSDVKIVRFNEWDTKELYHLKDMINGKVKVGIRKKRKYYYLEKVIANENEQTITE